MISKENLSSIINVMHKFNTVLVRTALFFGDVKTCDMRKTAKKTDALNSRNYLKIPKDARAGKVKFTSKYSSCFQTKPDCIIRQILDKFVLFFTLYTYKFCILTLADILSVQPILTKTIWSSTFYYC